MTAEKYNEIKPVKQETKKAEDIPTVESADKKKSINKIEGIVVAEKKKNIFERLVVGLAGPRGPKAIVADLYTETIVPAVQNMVYDSLMRGVQQAIFGDKHPGVPIRGVTQYHNMSRYPTMSTGPYANQVQTPPGTVTTVNPRNMVETYLIADRHKAELALHELVTWASTYGVSSVADYLDMLGKPSDFTHNGFGWTYQTLSQVRIVPSSGAYYLDLPRPIQIANHM